MARAVMRLYKGVSLAFGPTTEGGFYYDFDLPEKISEDDFPKIEAEMQSIIKDKEPFERFVLDRKEARKLCEDLDQDLKVEHIDTGLSDQPTVSFYRQGEFVDLCRGPHVPDAGKIKAIKLMSIAGSHWKGDTSGRQLQRLYGTAFFDKKELSAYLEQIEEAKRRDHRVLGKQHGLFAISPEVGQGLCLWLPKGARVRVALEDFLRKELLSRGYDPVYSPHIGRVEMYETSGHFPYYRESQFAPLFGSEVGALLDAWSGRLEQGTIDRDGEEKLMAAAAVFGVELPDYKPSASAEAKRRVLHDWQKLHERYLLKPMNCPHHCHIFKAQPAIVPSASACDCSSLEPSTGTSRPGELNGMLRVRGLTQDDAHIFCTADQVEDEFRATIDLTKFVLQSVGLDDYRVQLSLRDPRQRQVRWQRGELESSRERPARRAGAIGTGFQRRTGRSGVLRTQGRLHGARLHRTIMATGNGATRLQPARTIQAGVQRQRQHGAPTGDDSPRSVRFAGAVHRHVDRTFRRRVSALVVAGADSRAAAQ